MQRRLWLATLWLGALAAGNAVGNTDAWTGLVLPPEQQVETDPASGAKVTFVTTHPGTDSNFYFHERCFLANNRVMLFNSERFGRSEVMAYLLDTGELVRLMRPEDPGIGSRVASIKGDRFYAIKQGAIHVWELQVQRDPTTVRLAERKLVDLPPDAQPRSSLDENHDGSLLTFAYRLGDDYWVGFYDVASGQMRNPAKMGFKMDHLQFHRHRPDLVAFSRTYESGSDFAPLDPTEPRHARIWTMNVQTLQPLPAFFQAPGELATHECWWVNDQMTFVGGFHHEGDREEGQVKVLDFRTGEIRIIGAGAWVENVPGRDLARVNWWHAAGSPDGRWVAADNWHGIVALFDARTTRKRVLTTGHRVYGGGAHLHVGWDLTGQHVEFTSNRRGNPDVCIATVPEDWR